MTAPSGVFASLVTATDNSATISGTISSYGDPIIAPSQYIEVAVLESRNYQTPAITSRLEGSNDLTYSATLTESATLKIEPNTKYYYGAQASNGTEITTSDIGSFVSSPTPAVIRWVDEIIQTDLWAVKAKIAYTQPLGGKAKSLKLYYRYSLDGGTTWENNWTLVSQNTEQGYFYLSGLPFGQSVLVQTYTLGARASAYSDTVFTTQQEPEIPLTSVLNCVLNRNKYVAIMYGFKDLGGWLPDTGYRGGLVTTSKNGSSFSPSYSGASSYTLTRTTASGLPWSQLPSLSVQGNPRTPPAATTTVRVGMPPTSANYDVTSWSNVNAKEYQLPRPILGVVQSSDNMKLITDIAEVQAGEQLDASKLDIRYDRFITR